MRPIGKRIAVELITREAEEKVGSLYVPTQLRVAYKYGKVLAVGAQVEEIVAGNVVVFPVDASEDVDGHLFVFCEDVIAAE